MAEAAKTPDAAAGAEQTGEKKGKSIATIGIVSGLMVAEGLGIFFAMKFFGSEPDPTVGMTQLAVTTQPFGESKEVELAKVRVQNTNGARPLLYTVCVNLKVPADKETFITEDFLKNRQATVTDTISRIIRSADGKHLSEPGLETLKRRIGIELGTLLGDDKLIEEVLIPEFTPMPMGY